MSDNESLRYDFSLYKGASRDLDIVFTIEHECHRHPHPCICQMEDDDVMKLKVIDYRHKDKVVIEKESKGDSYFSFLPSDTEKLNVGYYRYSVKLYL